MVDAAKKANIPKDILISTDDKVILEHFSDDNSVILEKRLPRLADDKASSVEVLISILLMFHNYKSVILLQPTSPMRTEVDIEKAVEIFESYGDATSLISVKLIKQLENWLVRVDSSGFIHQSETHSLRRRLNSLDGFRNYMPNGAIYISNVESFLESKTFNQAKTIAFQMDALRSIDIDDRGDYEAFKALRKILN